MIDTDRIVHLPKEKWQGTVLPIGYTTNEYYAVETERTADGFSVSFRRREADPPIAHSPEEYDFPDKLYEPWWDGACAWGVIKGERLIAAIETCPEAWSNRLRVTELWVDAPYRRQGIGRALMAVAKEQARLECRRAVILETQSCNANAVGFYLHEGFTLIGCDTCAYSNRDIERREVRMELGWFPHRPRKLARQEVEIREERPEEYHAVEQMIRRAFWNRYRRGCDEHYLLHKMREDTDYLPQLCRIAVVNGEIAGGIFYTRSSVGEGERRREVLTFGPLGVAPEWQGAGIGEMLMRETMALAGKAGYPGIVIFGSPAYYSRVGFCSCARFGITTPDGKIPPALLGVELTPGAMRGISGVFHEAALFDAVSPSEAEDFDRNFPPMKKQYFPAQLQPEQRDPESSE